MSKETRIAEIRAVSEEKMIIEGYAIKFNEETLIGSEDYGFREIIDPQALGSANMKDVPLKYNHQDNFLVLARTRNKSLELTVDEVGLRIKAELLDTQSNRDIYKMVQNGLLDKMSFAFTVKSQSWDRTGTIPKRTITEIERLFDVSIVDVPFDDSKLQRDLKHWSIDTVYSATKKLFNDEVITADMIGEIDEIFNKSDLTDYAISLVVNEIMQFSKGKIYNPIAYFTTAFGKQEYLWKTNLHPKNEKIDIDPDDFKEIIDNARKVWFNNENEGGNES